MTRRSLRFLSIDDVLAIHEDTIETEGGRAGIRDVGLLESAVLMPQQQLDGQYLHPDPASMAAAYLFHISQNHPFQDGNKRTGALACLVFLKVNGCEVLPDPDELERMTLDVAAGRAGKKELVVWMRAAIEGEESGPPES